MPRLDAVTEPVETRAQRKERTRQALLDRALELHADRTFASVSLREVARAAGIVPTAFYRHFASMDELGVVLAEDSMRVLRRMLRDARRTPSSRNARDSLDILVRQVRAHEAEFRFVARERYGGVPEVRRAIATELRLFVSELTIDLGRMPALGDWEAPDLEMAADLIVQAMLAAVVDLLEVDRPGSADERAVIDRTAKQLRLITIGMGGWKPARP
ncbi:TetR family transcriptional regulator [Prescottella equi]|uniref:TetR family transcriptional regulator n=1 Tax=Rhodococcus hoagii TaxID=43767 RepID=UPI000A0FE902|nr:TetR family transcriptional regulator [Prescottella equi]ORL81296.1 TetR family transcriptional regulator [Prescottella equi]BCN44857.1 TetR family transcriptional regulator [Prescottella equi]